MLVNLLQSSKNSWYSSDRRPSMSAYFSTVKTLQRVSKLDAIVSDWFKVNYDPLLITLQHPTMAVNYSLFSRIKEHKVTVPYVKQLWLYGSVW
jgi:hypothetical protein